MAKEIHRITIVTAQGVEWFAIGRNGVTSITAGQFYVKDKEESLFYLCYGNDGLIAKISASCPMVIEYK